MTGGNLSVNGRLARPTAERAPAGPAGRTIGDAVDAAAPFLLGLAVLAYVAVIFLVQKWQLDTLRMGFDPLVYEQPLWNTLHGHLAALSAYAFTDSAFGQDLFLFHFVLLPFYALKPTTATLLFLQTVGAAAGAVAIYLIARDALPGRRIVPLLFAALFLSYLPMQNVDLYEVQPRLFAATFFLFAFWCMTRGYTAAFWVLIALALINRSDAALVVAALGLYGVLTRRKAAFSWLPLVIGAAYWVVAVFVVIPHFTHGAQFLFIENYGWLGGNVSAIARTIVTHPLFVLRNVLAWDRWQYAISLLFALAFLPLLQPRVLLMAAPPFLLNVFASPYFRYQRDIFHQYSAFVTPWLFVAAILAVAALTNGAHPILRAIPRMRAGSRRHSRFIAVSLLLLMLGLSAIQQAYTTPNKIGQFLHHRQNGTEIASADLLIAMIPADAPLAVTARLATRVPLRRYLYNFPGNESYSPALIDRAQYVLGDRDRDQGHEGEIIDRIAANGQWQVVKRQRNFELLRRVAPPPAGTP